MRDDSGGARRIPGPVVAAGVVTVLVYLLAVARAGGLGFVNYDDPEVVFENPVTSWDTVSRAFTGVMAHAWLPLYTLSLAVDRALFGTGSATGYHLHSILLHGLNASLVALLALRLGSGRALALGTGLLFGLHPAVTESVAWVASRKDVLSFLFAALAALAWVSAERGERRRPWLHGAGAVLLGLGLLAKGSVLVLPALLLAAAWALPGDPSTRRRRGLSVLPYAAVAVALTLVHLQVARMQGTLDPAPGPGPAAAAVEASGTLGRYLAFLLWPHPSSADAAGRGGSGLFALVLLAAAGGAVVAWRSGRRDGAALLVAVVAALAPFNGVFPRTTVPFAERYLYVAAAPAAALLALGALRLAGGRGPWVLALAGAALVVARVPDWKDSLTLWESAAALPDASPLARAKLGEALADLALGETDPERRREAFLRAAEVHRRAAAGQRRPVDRLRSLQNLGLALLGAGDPQGALVVLEEARGLLGAAGDPVDASVRAALEVNRAKALESLGREDEARAVLASVAASSPGEVAPWLNLGVLRLRAGDLPGAREALDHCLRLAPDLLAARLALADLELLSGDFPSALRAAAAAVDSAPGDTSALLKAGEIASLLGQPRRAEEWFRRAYDLAPDDGATRAAWAGALLGKARGAVAGGDVDGGLRLAEEAEGLDPESPAAPFLQGEIRRARGDGAGALEAYGRALRNGGGPGVRNAMAAEHLRQAAAHRAAGRGEEARAAVERALAGGPQELFLGGSLPRIEGDAARLPAAVDESAAVARRELLDGLLLLCEGEAPAAVASLSTALGAAASAPRTARSALILRSLARRWAGDDDGAVADLRALVKGYPGDGGARLLLGHALSARAALRRATGEGKAGDGDSVEARAALEEARRLDPSLEEASLALAELHFTEGRVVDALREINGVLRRDPERVEAHLVLGNILKAQYVGTEDRTYLEEAETAFRQALAMDSRDARALAGLGEVAIMGGQNREAMGYALRALSINPDEPRARTLGALLFTRAGRARVEARDEAGAEQAAARALELGGETAALCVLRADLHGLRKEYRRAGQELERARTLAPEDGDVRDAYAEHYRDVGYALLLSGRRPEAEEAFRRAVEARPPNTDLTVLRVLLERGGEPTGDGKGVDPALREALDGLVAAARERFEAGAALLRAEKPAEAAEAFRDSLRQFETSHARFALGVALDGAGDGDGAVEAYRRAVVLNPVMADAWLNLGGLLFRRGDDDGCMAAYGNYLRFKDRAARADAETVGRVQGILRALEERKSGAAGGGEPR